MHPEGRSRVAAPYVTVSHPTRARGEIVRLPYDYLINATGPKLSFEAARAGSGGNSRSVCTAGHAVETATCSTTWMARHARAASDRRSSIGTGHGTVHLRGCCVRVHLQRRARTREEGVRDMAEVIYLTNETRARRLRRGGPQMKTKRRRHPQQTWAESLYPERGVKCDHAAHVERVEPGVMHYEQVDGDQGALPLRLRDADPALWRRRPCGHSTAAGSDITPRCSRRSGFMKVDADYSTALSRTRSGGQGLAEAHTSRRSTQHVGGRNRIRAAAPDVPPPDQPQRDGGSAPAPPRTGMPSGMHRSGRRPDHRPAHEARSAPRRRGPHRRRWPHMGAACMASAGKGGRNRHRGGHDDVPVRPRRGRVREMGRDPTRPPARSGLTRALDEGACSTTGSSHKAKARPAGN